MFVENYEEKLELCTPALRTIVEEFGDAAPRERLDYLLEYAMDLPDLPERLESARDGMEQVHECQTPVFLHTELENGVVHFFLDIPRESPTVRGYASIVVAGLDGTTPAEIERTPDDLYLMLGLQEAISPQRLRGLYYLLQYMKRQVRALAA